MEQRAGLVQEEEGDRNRVNCRPGGGKRQLEQPLIQPDVSQLAPDLAQHLPLTEGCAWLFWKIKQREV